MPKSKNKKTLNDKEKKLKIELIPDYESEVDFQRRKNNIQDILSKMIILATTRGRVRKEEMENIKDAA